MFYVRIDLFIGKIQGRNTVIQFDDIHYTKGKNVSKMFITFILMGFFIPYWSLQDAHTLDLKANDH